MRALCFGGELLPVKDYHCADDTDVYIPREDPKLWLYINLTNRCNGGCPFCVNPAVNRDVCAISIEKLKKTLLALRNRIGGVSITGGEPMLYPELVDAAAEAVTEILGAEIQLELVTNGTRLSAVSGLGSLARLDAVHISRHGVSDGQNAALMGAAAPTMAQLGAFIAALEDPGQVVLNCVLQKGAVDSVEAVREYLEMAAGAHVRNVSFVGMFPANEYCRERYVSPKELSFREDGRFTIWNRFHDYGYCSCSSGDYRAKSGYIRFYYRCPGSGKPGYVRQLVYNHDDRLLAGFGGREIRL